MQNCVKCKTQIVSTNCIKTEEDYPFKFESFDELLKLIYESGQESKKILSKKIDRKWIKEEKEYSVEYIQDLINRFEIIIEDIKKLQEPIKYEVESVVGQKTSQQLFAILFKRIESLEKGNSYTSIYTPS